VQNFERLTRSWSSTLRARTQTGELNPMEMTHARQILNELKALSARQYVPPYDMGIVYLGLGEKEEVYRWLERGLDSVPRGWCI
jgi:hypothetical protein